MKTTRLLYPIVLAPILIVSACHSLSRAPDRPAEIASAEADPDDTCDSCLNYVEVDLDSCVCAGEMVVGGSSSSSSAAAAPSRAPRPQAAGTSPGGSSLTVNLWSLPDACIPCLRLERMMPTTFYCDGADVTINYVRNCGRNPKGGTIPTATINGQTVSGTQAILTLIQQEIDLLPCD